MNLLRPLAVSLFAIIATVADAGDDAVRGVNRESFHLTIPAEFQIEEPIPDGDQWLESLLVGLGSGVRLSTRDYAVWRQTDILLNVDGENIGKRVFARDLTEDRFLVLTDDSASAKQSRPWVVSWFLYRMWDPPSHVMFYVSPSKRYIVVVAEEHSPIRATREQFGPRRAGWIVEPLTVFHSEIQLSSGVWEVDVGVSKDRLRVAKWKKKAAEPGATDNPDDAQRLREDH